MASRSFNIIALLTATVLGGCTVGPDYRPPQTPMPVSFDSGPASPPASQPTTQATKQPSIDMARWWQSLGDPELDSLIDRAITANLDLRIALMRLQEARAREYIVTGGALPLVDVSAAAARGSGSDSTRGRVPGPLHSGDSTAGLKEITEVAGLDATWEIDLFGRFRREIEASRADAQAAAAARSAVLISVVSDVARAYIDERALSLRLAVAQQNLKLQQQSVELTSAKFNQGIIRELDVALAKRQLATVQATIAPLQEAIADSQRRLAVLLGKLPHDLYDELQQPSNLPDPPQTIQPGLPVELLRRRPDIREAERELAASTARIGVATANLFPRVALLGAYGFQGQGLGRVPVTNKMIWSLGPSLYWPALDFGVLDSIVEYQDLRTQELLYSYQRTVLQAVEEVDNAIGNYIAQRDRLDRLNAAVDASRRALELATQGYQGGFTDYLNVLDAQRQLYDLQDQQAIAQQVVALQYIALYKALGGGWENYQNIPPIRQPQPALIAAGREVVAPTHAPR